MEEQEVKKSRSPRKKRYYIGYKYKPKSFDLYGYLIVEATGAVDFEAVQKDLAGKHKTGSIAIVSCFETK